MSATISCPLCSWRLRRCSVPSPSPVKPTVLSMWPGSWARALLTSSHRPGKKVKNSIQKPLLRAEDVQLHVYTPSEHGCTPSAHRQHDVMLYTHITAVILLHIFINAVLTCLSHHVHNSRTSRDCTKRNLWICGIRGNSSCCENYSISCRRRLWFMRVFLARSFRSAPWFSCHTNRPFQSQERGESWLWWTGKYTVFENGTWEKAG